MAKNNQSNKKYVPKKQGGYIPPSNTNKKKSKFTLSQWIVFILMIFWSIGSIFGIFSTVKFYSASASVDSSDNDSTISLYSDSVTAYSFITVPLYFCPASTLTIGRSNPIAQHNQFLNILGNYYTFNFFIGDNPNKVSKKIYCDISYVVNGESIIIHSGNESGVASDRGYPKLELNNNTPLSTFLSYGIVSYFTVSDFINYKYGADYHLLSSDCTLYWQVSSMNINFSTISTVSYSLTTSDSFSNNTLKQSYVYTDSNGETLSIFCYTYGTISQPITYTRYLSEGFLADDNYNLGYSNGYENGYINGESDGLNSGYGQGYDIGYTDGKNVGYNQGVLESNDYSFLGLLGAVVDAPISVVSQWLNFDLLGFNMSSFFFAICTLALTIAIIRLIL